jgi:hypothetical protein
MSAQLGDAEIFVGDKLFAKGFLPCFQRKIFGLAVVGNFSVGIMNPL